MHELRAELLLSHLKNRGLKRWRWLIDLIMKYRYGSQVENRDAAYLTAMDF